MKKLGWFIVLVLISSASMAVEKVRNLNTYLGGGVGVSKDVILDKFYNETVVSGKIFAGATYNTFSALEVSYAYLGSFANGNVKEHAVALNLVAFAPLTDAFRLIAKAGMYYYQLDVSGTKTNDNEITYGLGLKYNVDYHHAIRGEWERYKSLGGSDVDMYSVSYSLRFGNP
ncbi:hypothetical protein MNBD_GAMMA25-1203 [hydrothermal vent metagenome]|uniref:Outer membrane protein beta-barrel domain-containing protein n=1 Tax=hydrothermal vent metagenome TaxID=652676 RepID=A0A3B1BGK7_9ZZZZ